MSQASVLTHSVTELLHRTATSADLWLNPAGSHGWRAEHTPREKAASPSGYPFSDVHSWHRKSPLPDISKAHSQAVDDHFGSSSPPRHDDATHWHGATRGDDDLSPREHRVAGAVRRSPPKSLTPLSRSPLTSGLSSSPPHGSAAAIAAGVGRASLNNRRTLPPRVLPPISRPGDREIDDVADGCRPRNPTPEQERDGEEDDDPETGR